MKPAIYTKMIQSEEFNNPQYSIGFKRYVALPSRLKTSLQTAYFLKTNDTNTHDYIVSFFKNMTEIEYKNWCLAN